MPSLASLEDKALSCIQEHGPRLQRLNESVREATWNLYTLGGAQEPVPGETEESRREQISKCQERYAQALEKALKQQLEYVSNPSHIREVEPLFEDAAKWNNPQLQRQIAMLYYTFLSGKTDPALKQKINDSETELQLLYGDFSPQWQGQTLTDGEVEDRLKQSTDPEEARTLAEAKYAIGSHRLHGKGAPLGQKILDTIALRNEYAHTLGFKNYYQFSLAANEIDEKQLVDLIQKVKQQTNPLYKPLRKQMDQAAVKRYGISMKEARLPWFQGGINDFGILDDVCHFSLDDYYRGIDPRPLIQETAYRMGTSAEAILEASDLFSRPGKNPHWYLFPIKTPVDIRSLGNMDPDFQSRMGYTINTLLHELIGHGLGFAFVSKKLPPLFRGLHGITTESDAMMMEALVYDKKWLTQVLGLSTKAANQYLAQSRQYHLANQLVCFRWKYLLIPDFERELYAMDDGVRSLGNANALWARKVEEYTGILIPADRNQADWAYKIHFATAPVYYQYYFLAQLMRAQVHQTINGLSRSGLMSKKAGQYLKKHRSAGQTYAWDELVERMTGTPLGTEALMQEFAPLGR